MLVKALGTTIRRQLATSAASNRPLTLSFIISGGGDQVQTESFVSASEFRKAFSGFRFTNPKTNNTHPVDALPNHIDPSVVYVAKHPFLEAWLDDFSHNQISDKVFEDKACNALDRHLNQGLIISRRIPDNPTRQDGWRIFSTGGKIS
jgi:hypothetical protein